MSTYAQAEQQYFDPPDPVEKTYAVSVEFDIRAVSEEDATQLIRKIFNEAVTQWSVSDWYVDDLHPYGEDVEEEPERE